MPDRYLLVRAAAVYLAVIATLAACVWQRPSRRAMSAAVLAAIWSLPALLLLHLAARRFGWWTFDAAGGLFLDMPVEFYLAWAWLWGALPILAVPTMPLWAVLAVALAVDVALMPAASPVIQLGPQWLVGEAIGLAIVLTPSQLLARWTLRDQHLLARTSLQVAAFGGFILLVIPLVVLQASRSRLDPIVTHGWRLSIVVQVLAIPALVGISAVQEFATRGAGTPVPFDPPRHLVTTGVYAYVRNPMQLSAVVLFLLMGVVVRNGWIAAAGVLAHVYSAGLAGWDEDEDLMRRFGSRWTAYRTGVRAWMPRLRPWYPPDLAPARLFVATGCDMCRDVGAWFQRHGARDLAIVPAITHPTAQLTRITYERPGDARAATGIEAMARALEHVHLGWAFVGLLLRLPVVASLAQLLADASGAEPRAAV